LIPFIIGSFLLTAPLLGFALAGLAVAVVALLSKLLQELLRDAFAALHRRFGPLSGDAVIGKAASRAAGA